MVTHALAAEPGQISPPCLQLPVAARAPTFMSAMRVPSFIEPLSSIMIATSYLHSRRTGVVLRDGVGFEAACARKR